MCSMCTSSDYEIETQKLIGDSKNNLAERTVCVPCRKQICTDVPPSGERDG